MTTTHKYLDDNGLLYYDGKQKARLNNKVDKVEGKGLSTNDYTTAEKNKLAGLENYSLPIASAGTLGGVKVGAGLAIDSETGVLNATGTEVTIDSELSTTSTNPAQNKVITTAINNKVDKINGKGLSTNDYTTTEKTKLSGIAENAEVNKIDVVKVNGTALTITSKAVDVTVPTNNNQLTNGAGYQTASDVSSAIATAISATYKASGSIAFENLPTLGASVLGNVYNITNDFTTTADFVEGAGKAHKAGSNVAIVKVNSAYKYDVMAGFVDLSEYVQHTDLNAITNSEIDDIVNTSEQ